VLSLVSMIHEAIKLVKEERSGIATHSPDYIQSDQVPASLVFVYFLLQLKAVTPRMHAKLQLGLRNYDSFDQNGLFHSTVVACGYGKIVLKLNIIAINSHSFLK